jgi:hypothetical protein
MEKDDKYKRSRHTQLNRGTSIAIIREGGFVMTQLNTKVEEFMNTQPSSSWNCSTVEEIPHQNCSSYGGI